METTNCISLSTGPSSDYEDLQGEDQCDFTAPIPPNDVHEEKTEKVILGKEFMNVESAYRFYVNYGGKLRFNVRKKHRKKNSDGFVTRYRYCCSKEGYRANNKRSSNASYSQPITRCGCKAHMTCLLQKNGNFRVVSFQESHN